MAKKKQAPNEQFAVWEERDTTPYLVFNNSVEDALEYDETDKDETVVIMVYKLDRVLKVQRQSTYKIVEQSNSLSK